MDNINNGPSVDGVYNKNSKTGDIKDVKSQKIDKGFSTKNSYSSQEKRTDTLSRNNVNKPKLDAPTLSPPQLEKGMEEMAAAFEGDKQTKEDLLKTDKNDIAKKINSKDSKNKVNKSLQLVYEKNQKNNKNQDNIADANKKVEDKANQQLDNEINTINNKIDNKIDINNKTNKNSINTENKITIKNDIPTNNKKGGVDKNLTDIMKFSTTFFEVANKFSRIKSAPKELMQDLTKKVNSLVADLTNGKQELDTDTALVKLMEIKSILNDTRITLEKENIKVQQSEKERLANKEMEKILESIEKSKEAKKSGGIGKILGYIGAALMIVVSAVMVATAVFTGGTTAIVAAALIVTATSLMITMQASQETGGWMTKMFGEDNELAATIFLTAVIVILSVGAGAASGMGAAGSVASSAAKFVSIGDKITKGATLASAGTQMASATADGVAAYQQYEATELSADAKKERAKWLKVQLFIDENMDRLIKQMRDMHTPIQDLLNAYKSNAKSKSEVLRNFT